LGAGVGRAVGNEHSWAFVGLEVLLRFGGNFIVVSEVLQNSLRISDYTCGLLLLSCVSPHFQSDVRVVAVLFAGEALLLVHTRPSLRETGLVVVQVLGASGHTAWNLVGSHKKFY